MTQEIPCILCLNGGSSSLKFSIYRDGDPQMLLISGELERLGTETAEFMFTRGDSGKKVKVEMQPGPMGYTIDFLISWLEKQVNFSSVLAAGHRIVHGMNHTMPALISADLLKELHEISPIDPEHLPSALCIIDRFQLRFPELKQVACFDTSFHSGMPLVSSILPLPRRYFNRGIRRYGFHGLSYSYLLYEFGRLAGEEPAHGKIIIAHLGNGASLAAVKNGRSIDTSMGFTPGSGIPMSSRSGDLDPGLATYLMKAENLSPDVFSNLVNHESGLLGVSEISGDLRDLHTSKAPAASEAIDLFCYQVKKQIGAYAAALEGLDTLIFSGGIGENDAGVRAAICKGLGFLGIELDKKANEARDWHISSEKSRVSVYRMKTNEELMIARAVSAFLKTSGSK